MSEMAEYYERFLQVVKSDIDEMLQEPEIGKRVHKQIKALLDMASDCEAKLDSFDDVGADWSKLSADAQRQILEIIENDR